MDKSNFYANKRNKSGKHSYCKVCTYNKIKKVPDIKLKKLEYQRKNKHYYDNWRRLNKDKISKYDKNFRQNNKGYLAAKSAKQRANKIQRTPSWADLTKINEFYKNCPKGYHVDHILPLNGKNVCGLHVLSNLQYLEAKENIMKSNKFKMEVYCGNRG